ncbi:endonuclease-reverse transcriptase domain-containing protein [Phthorimaea operculella]|nr:endonuclease-reverse transcriptase domain-containing protein [Phthorimaea operculella]
MGVEGLELWAALSWPSKTLNDNIRMQEASDAILISVLEILGEILQVTDSENSEPAGDKEQLSASNIDLRGQDRITWITSEEHAQKCNLPNYTHYFNFRTDRTGGGVSAYVHNDLKHTLIDSVYSGGNNFLWVKLQKYALDIGIVYNPGDTNFDDFIETLDTQIQQRKRALLFGDFNINLIEKADKQIIKKKQKYINIMNAAGYKILNKTSKKYYTRKTHIKTSILDHVATNLRNDTFNFALIESSLSDHRQIHLTLKKYRPPPKQRITYKAIDYENLYQAAEKSRFESKDLEQLTKSLGDHIEKARVEKSKILNLPQEDWIDKSVIEAINQRNILWAELQRKFTMCLNDPKKLWNLFNYLSNNKLKSNCSIPKLVVNLKTITDPTEVCCTFNQYFASIGSILANQIPPHYHNTQPISLPQTNINTLTVLQPATLDEITTLIDNLDPNSSNGIDALTLNNIPLDKKSSEKYLGLILDDKVSWKPHLERIKKKLSSLMGSIRRIARCMLWLIGIMS